MHGVQFGSAVSHARVVADRSQPPSGISDLRASATRTSGPRSLSSRLVQREYFRSRARLDSQFLADAGKNFILVVITSLISTLAALGITPNAI
jgi:hypothetical protein